MANGKGSLKGRTPTDSTDTLTNTPHSDVEVLEVIATNGQSQNAQGKRDNERDSIELALVNIGGIRGRLIINQGVLYA